MNAHYHEKIDDIVVMTDTITNHYNLADWVRQVGEVHMIERDELGAWKGRVESDEDQRAVARPCRGGHVADRRPGAGRYRFSAMRVDWRAGPR